MGCGQRWRSSFHTAPPPQWPPRAGAVQPLACCGLQLNGNSKTAPTHSRCGHGVRSPSHTMRRPRFDSGLC